MATVPRMKAWAVPRYLQNRKSADPWSRMGMKRQWEEEADRQRQYGAGMPGVIKEATAFDPRKALNEWATGAGAGVARELAQTQDAIRGTAVGTGRYNTGFYLQDQGEAYADASGRFSEALAGQAMTAASMYGQNLDRRADYATAGTDRYTQMLGARYEEEENNWRERQARRRKNRFGLGDALELASSFVP